MASLTDRRFERAKSILDKYRTELQANSHISVGKLENELRDCRNLGYQELKSVIIDLSKRGEYRFLAAYYMEGGTGVGVVSEFKDVLAEMCSIEYYDDPKRDEARKAFWQRSEKN
jgi:hypothetical protein